MLCVKLTVCFLIVASLQVVLGQNNCDKLGTLLYEDIGCKPIKPADSECPTRFECGNFTKQSNRCLLRGKSFNQGEQVDNDITYPSCNVGCFCRGETFTCAILDCPEWLGVPIGPGCYRKYEADKCCSVGEICPTPGSKESSCTVEGREYREGEKFSLSNSCSLCVCPKDFNGKFEEPHCKRRSCTVQIRNGDKLEKNCAPFYSESVVDKDVPLCCPSSWICPSENDKIIKINKDVKENPDLLCKFGSKTVKLGEGVERDLKNYDDTIRKVRCECILPPFLTCKQV